MALTCHLLVEVFCMFEGLFQPMHLLVILIIAMLVFGPKRLPELGKGLGEGIRSFRNATREGEKGEGDKDQTKESPAAKQ